MKAKLLDGAIASNHQKAVDFMEDMPESQIVVITLLWHLH
jgi:hypothetical protein